jgi:hypothetical protein
MDDTTPLVGVRQEFDHDLGNPIHQGYFALIDGTEDEFPHSRLWVREGALLVGNEPADLKPMRNASYVLFSTRGTSLLTELSMLPFYERVKTVIDLASTGDVVDWKRAKAELLVLFRELLSSADLTRKQALQYHDEVVQQARDAHRRASLIGTLSADSETPEQDELRRASPFSNFESTGDKRACIPMNLRK